MPATRSSELESGIVTVSSPSKLRARPKRPSDTRVAPESVPGLPVPDVSMTAEPDASSNAQAPTSPGNTGQTVLS
jgi:hypothetical protein